LQAWTLWSGKPVPSSWFFLEGNEKEGNTTNIPKIKVILKCGNTTVFL
jgi:hypothetical protein